MNAADDVRARFDDATRRHLTGPLVPGVELRLATADEHQAHQDALWASSSEQPAPDLQPLFSDGDRAAFAALAAVRGPALSHRVLLCAGDEVVGTYHGVQEDHGRYYMVNTVVRRDVQGRGLYRAFLPRVVAAVREAGFREIHSRHRADNNAVLVPKLKAGFVITGFEIAPRDGILVALCLYLHGGLGKLFHYRVDGSHAAALRAAGVPLP